jgi:hypothetical protein
MLVPLRSLVQRTLQCLSDDTIYDDIIEFLNDALPSCNRVFDQSVRSSIATLFESDWGQRRYNELVGGDFEFESLQFGLFMLAYGEAELDTLMKSTAEEHRRVLWRLAGLLAASGHLVAEDTIFVHALEFWCTFAEALTDSIFSGEDLAEFAEPSDIQQEWAPFAKNMVLDVVGRCYQKIRYPSIEVFMSWDSTERTGFADARKDVADFLQTVHNFGGRTLVSNFVDLLLESIPGDRWAELEAAAFCLSAISDCISDQEDCDDLLQKAFSAPFFNLLALGETHLPVRLRQTALSLIERYSEYFERHSEFLPTALNILFSAVGSPHLSSTSSKSISTLCSSCRSLLTGEVEAFLGYYHVLHANQEVDALAEERLVMAISSVIQAISDEGHRLQAVERLLSFVRNDVEQCLQLKSSGGQLDVSNPVLLKALKQCQGKETQVPSPEEVIEHIAVHALRCLAGMAKGLQATVETVDLTSHFAATQRPRSEQLVALQNSIIGMIVAIKAAFPSSGEIVETTCNILKAGFAESDNGPFVLLPEAATELLTREDMATPRIGVVVSTACTFVSSLIKGPRAHVAPNIDKLLPWVLALIQQMEGTCFWNRPNCIPLKRFLSNRARRC